MRLVFFNHYHNGDIFASKGYVSDLIKEFRGWELYYQHFHSSKLLRDLNIEFKNLELPMAKMSDRDVILSDKENIYVNTWIGNYLPYGDGINWNTYHEMFSRIYSFLSDMVDRSIDLGPIDYYFPEIKYEYFDIPDIKIPEGSIIISNGPVLSGQSNLPDLNNLINSLIENTDRNIILTHFAPFTSEKVSYTNNIIKTTNGDLNEISWIASQCEYVIGRNSGPFCFMNTKQILSDKSKKIFSIGNNEKDSFIYNVSVKADYKYFDDSNVMSIVDLIR